MITRLSGMWLLASLAAGGCAKARDAAPVPKRCSAVLACPVDHTCSASLECVPRAGSARDAAVSGDAGLSENRVPDAGARVDAGVLPNESVGYRIQGSLSAYPDRPAGDYVLQDQRLELLQARCGKVGEQTLCVSGSLNSTR